MKATSVKPTDASPKLEQQAKPKGGHVATDYFNIKPCLGCGVDINVRAPWGRFEEEGEEAGVCSVTCNQVVLNHRADVLFAPRH